MHGGFHHAVASAVAIAKHVLIASLRRVLDSSPRSEVSISALDERENSGRAGMVRLLSVVALAILATGSIAEAQARSRFDLPSQPLADSLRAIGSQANINVLFDPPLVADREAPPLKGEYTSNQAFTLLLVGTGITHEFMNDHTVVLVESPATSGSASPEAGQQKALRDERKERSENVSFSPSEGSNLWQRFRIAQAETAAPAMRGEGAARGEDSVARMALEEVIVTAQKREERLQDVPISLSVLAGADLDKSSFVNLADTLNQIPGVVAATYMTATQVQVRGVSASGPFFSGASPVGYYLDSVPFGFVRSAIAPTLNPYDLARIEALRGPQGTLYGAGGQGGVVRILTNEPNLTDFEFKSRLSTSNTDDSGWNYGGDAAINVPIVDGKLALRGVVGYQDLSGWIDGPADDDVNDSELRNYRLKMKAQPTDRLSVGLSWWRVRDDLTQSNATDDGRTFVSTREPIDSRYDAYGLALDYDFSAFSLSSMTSYIDYQSGIDQDLSRFGLSGFRIDSISYVESSSQEFILNSTHQGPWRWTAGAIYREAKDRQFQTTNPVPIIYSDTGAESESAAVFGELTRSISGGKLEATVGVRYFHDDVIVEELSVLTPTPGVPLSRAEDTFDKTTFRAILAWHPDDNLSVYGSFSQGFRSGQPQTPGPAASFPPVRPDTLHNYELGAKGSLWNGLVAFDAAIYFIDWQDVQQQLGLPYVFDGTTVCCALAMVNGSAASGPGVDLGVTIRPAKGLEFGATFSWNDLTLDGDVMSGTDVIFAEGERLNFSSEYTAGASASYIFPFGQVGLNGRLALSANYSSEQVNRLGIPPPVVVITGDDFMAARASFAIESDSGWTVRLYGDNLTNESGGVPRFAPPLDMNPRNRPRTVGIQVDFNW